jgi:hypothetical protein
VSKDDPITVELLDRNLKPIPGYSGDACIPFEKNDLRVEATWKDKAGIDVDGPVRLRINWPGVDNRAQLFAAYVEQP